jgi:hypothetical protein
MSRRNRLVGIMVASSKERKSTLQLYLRFNKPNVKLFCFTPTAINWREKSIIGLHRVNSTWSLSRFPFPQVVYNRCYGSILNKIEHLESLMGRDKCFNHINQFNKRETYEIISNSELAAYLPETVSYDQENPARLLEVQKDIYFKPFYGSRGTGVYRVVLKETGDIHIGHNHFAPTIIAKDASQFKKEIHELMGRNPYIVQRGVPIQQLNQQTFDIRVLVQKNKRGLWSVTNVVSRIAYKGCYNTSVSEKICLSEEILKTLYSSDTVDALIHSFHDISLRAAAIMESHTKYHLGELSVDFALDNDGRIWIIEINGKPQKDIYKEIKHYRRVYRRPLQYAAYLIKHAARS